MVKVTFVQDPERDNVRGLRENGFSEAAETISHFIKKTAGQKVTLPTEHTKQEKKK